MLWILLILKHLSSICTQEIISLTRNRFENMIECLKHLNLKDALVWSVVEFVMDDAYDTHADELFD